MTVLYNYNADGLQGNALLTAKKLLCGDEWDSKKPTKVIGKKWSDFLSVINCQKANANYLLDFAGYKEDGGTIDTASHYREYCGR